MAEAAHPAAVEEAAVATASNRKWNQLQTQKLLIFIKRQRNLFEFSLSFFSETVYNTFISKCSEELIMNRILIVEDDKDISRELKELLENSGYEAVVLTDFKNACDSIIAAEPDLVLLDINIPYMNGEMLLQQLRSKSDVPVIMVTSRVSRDELMTELWNNEEYLNDNALTVNISRLRGRFKDIGLEDVIETRKGQGYILV